MAPAASASAFSAPTASTILSLVRLPPKALGMKALTLGGKRERMEVKRPGSEEAGGPGAVWAGAAGLSNAEDDEAALMFAPVESETKLPAPIERGIVKEVE